MSDINEQDISGLTFVVTEGGGKVVDLLEDEFYPAKLVKIVKKDSINPKYPDPQLNWMFELSGEEFKYTYDEKEQQRVVYGNTSLIFSCNTSKPSRLYTWYSKLSGTSLGADEKITGKDLQALIGTDVAITVKPYKGKDKKGNEVTKYSVEKVKLVNKGTVASAGTGTIAQKSTHVAAKTVSKPVVSPVAKSKNPGGITEPEDIPTDDIGVSNGKEVEDDLFKDVF